MDFQHADKTEWFIRAFYTVCHTLGRGFLKKVYRGAMTIELHRVGRDVIQSRPASLRSSAFPHLHSMTRPPAPGFRQAHFNNIRSAEEVLR